MKKKLRWWGIILIVISSIVALFALIALVNFFFNLALRSYIKTFSPVKYDYEQIAPEEINYDGKTYKTFTTDRDFKVMQITDVHLGGGFMSFNKDKKAINCVITMIQNEKPDLVVFTGDNVFPIPYIAGTINNKMIMKTFIAMAEQTGVYYTTLFGNHDTEAFSYYNRKSMSKMFVDPKLKYSVYERQEDVSGESNSIILVRNKAHKITKTLLMIDSNDYIDQSLKSTMNWLYDTIHEDQIKWAKDNIEHIKSLPEGVDTKVLAFMHIPVSEYHIAFEELRNNNFEDTANTHYVTGVNDELDDETPSGRVWYGGCSNWKDKSEIESLDLFFETLLPYLDGIFCGHDHVNNLRCTYKGVYLSYGYSVDYLAYSNIDKVGMQRGNTVITIKNNGTWSEVHNNYYTSNYVSEKGELDNADYSVYYYPGNEIPKN